jgi:hypothetical protein
LTLADRVPEESRWSQARGLKRDDARNCQEVTRVLFAGEVLESAGKKQYGEGIVRWLGHGVGAVFLAPSPAPGMSSPALRGLSGERVAAETSAGLTFSGW